MPLRRRAWLSREGWYYVGVLAFIVGGAVLRSINLLVILAGMMMGPLLLNWRLVMASLRGLIIARKIPSQITAGTPFTVEISVENTHRWMGSWLIVIEDRIERVESTWPKLGGGGTGLKHHVLTFKNRLAHWLHGDGTRAEALVASVPPHSTAMTTYRLTLPRRGRYRFGPLRVSTRFPLGLVRGHFTLPASDEMIVLPRLGRLSPEWVQLLESESAGDLRRQEQRGIAEGDYYGLRPWQSGDSTRWIHWRTTAKLGIPTVMQFERQRSRDVAVILDCWLPNQPTEQEQGHFELAVSVAATAVADLTSRGHSRLTFAVAANAPLCWSAPASSMFCKELLTELAGLSPAGIQSIFEAIAAATDQAPTGARLIVISPRSPAAAAGRSGPTSGTPGGSTMFDAENIRWIDVSSAELPNLFAFE